MPSPKWCIQFHWKLDDTNLSVQSSFIRKSIRVESREKRLSYWTAEPCMNPHYKLVTRWNFWHELRSSPCKAFITTSSCFFLASRSVLIDSRMAVLKISTCIARHKYILLTKRARAVLREYRPEVLTVRTKRSVVRTRKTKGRYSPSTVPSKLG